MKQTNKRVMINGIILAIIKESYFMVNCIKENTGYLEDKISKILDAAPDEEKDHTSSFVIFSKSEMLREEREDIIMFSIIYNLISVVIRTDKEMLVMSLAKLISSELFINTINTLCISEKLLLTKVGLDLNTKNTFNIGKHDGCINKLSSITILNLFPPIMQRSNMDCCTPPFFSALLCYDNKNEMYAELVMDGFKKIDESISALVLDAKDKPWNNVSYIHISNTIQKEINSFISDNIEQQSSVSLKNSLVDFELTIKSIILNNIDKLLIGSCNTNYYKETLTIDIDQLCKLGNKKDIIKEGSVNSEAMTNILHSCIMSNDTRNSNLMYSFNNPPKYSTIVFSPDYKISEILEVKDINKQAEAEYLENKNIICVYNDKKEKHNSYEAILNIDIENDSSKANGYGRLDFHITGYGVDKEGAICNLNIIYIDIMNKFHGLKK